MSANRPTCAATRNTLTPGVVRQCKRRPWGGTEFCYQHAIAFRAALVITEEHLRWALDRDRDGDEQSRRAAHSLWLRLAELTR